MDSEPWMQLVAVVVGGLLAIAGGILTTLLVERQRVRRDSLHLALAFRGEIGALLEHIRERGYVQRFATIAREIEETGQPFFTPVRVRFQYDRVYEANVGRLGLLKSPLPERIPLFYNRLVSIFEDLVSLGDGTYASLDIALILRIYRDCERLLAVSLKEGEEILRTIDEAYDLRR